MSKSNKTINGVDYVIASTACESLGISLSTLKRMRYDGKIGYYELNERCVLYNLNDIESIKRSKQIPRRESNMAIVQTNDGNLMFNGVLFLRELTVATKLGVTLENLRRLPNTRNIVGPDGQRYYNKQDIDRLFVEGKAKRDQNKKVIKG